MSSIRPYFDNNTLTTQYFDKNTLQYFDKNILPVHFAKTEKLGLISFLCSLTWVHTYSHRAWVILRSTNSFITCRRSHYPQSQVEQYLHCQLHQPTLPLDGVGWRTRLNIHRPSWLILCWTNSFIPVPHQALTRLNIHAQCEPIVWLPAVGVIIQTSCIAPSTHSCRTIHSFRSSYQIPSA